MLFEKEIKEISYLKKISSIADFTIKSVPFVEINKINNLMDLYTKTFKPQQLINTNNEFVINKDILDLFNKKIDNNNITNIEHIKEYYCLSKISFGVLTEPNKVSGQNINSRYKIIPLYLIPTLIKLSIDNSGTENLKSSDDWKRKIKENQPNVEFIIADKPFIPQELFDYNITASEHLATMEHLDLYLPIFNMEEADNYESKLLSLFEEEKDSCFPLLDKDDEYIKDVDYIESLYLNGFTDNKKTEIEKQQILKENLTKLFLTLKKHLDIIKAKKNLDVDFTKILIAPAAKAVDILYKSYCLIDDSIKNKQLNIEPTKIVTNFFQRDQKEIIEDQDKIFFNSKHHYGSFNIGIKKDKLFSLALNQRIVLNSTNIETFKDGEILSVNGPPGTGKTTVLQTIIANMVTENVLDFVEDSNNKKSFVWDKKSNIKTPKLLNIGCSFTKQAVDNILKSLDFEIPKYNNKIIDLTWNKRWIYFEDREQQLNYVLDSKEYANNKKQIDYFSSNIDNLIIFFNEKYSKIFSNSQTNQHITLKNELLKTKTNLNSFNLELFSNLFFLNNSNNYQTKSIYLQSFEDIEKEFNDNIIKINSFSQDIDLLEKEINKKHEELSLLKNLLEQKNHEIHLLKNHNQDKENLSQIEPKILQLQKDIKKFKLEFNSKNKKLDTNNIKFKNIKKSILSRVKYIILGEDKKLDSIQSEILTIINEINNLNKTLMSKQKVIYNLTDQQNTLTNNLSIVENIYTRYNKESIEFIIKEISEEINQKISIINAENERINTLKQQLNHKNVNKNSLQQRNKVLNSDKKELESAKIYIRNIINNIEIQLKNKCFDEFFYAREAINNLLLNIKNIEPLKLYEDLNLILDNTLRYKCFQLSMRLKEYYFLQLTKELSLLEKDNYYDSYDVKSKRFKNTNELYELNYFSLIYPLIVSTLHSLGKKVSLFFKPNKQDKGFNITKPGKIDNIIVDESGQISVEIGFIAAWNAKRLLCIGDTDQIKPVFSVEKKLDYFVSIKHGRINNILEEEYCTSADGLGKINCSKSSLMEIAQKLTKYHQYKNKELSRGLYLVEHRRCPEEIIEYCNKIIYKDVLISCKGKFNEIIKEESDFIKSTFNKPWQFEQVLGNNISNSNVAEANAIFNYVEKLINKSEGKYTWNNIGNDLAILSPYRNQANSILNIIKDKSSNSQFKFGSNRLMINVKESNNDLIIGTVHALQGAEKKIILFSFCSNELNPNSMVIRDKSILNVAISRSKLSIVLFGHPNVYKSNTDEMKLIRNYIEI